MIIDGKKISSEILGKVKEDIKSLDFTPLFCDVLVGGDLASKKYVKMKMEMAESLGIRPYEASFDESITTEALVKEIQNLNKIPFMCGIIVQLPLPTHINEREVLDAIDPKLDVDALGSIVNTNFYQGKESLGLPTALACMHILESLNVDLKNKKIIVMGQGELVGRPVAYLLSQKGYDVTTLRSQTENKENILKNADVVVSGIGKGKYITGDMIKEGAIVVDAGTSELGSLLVGDVDFESVKDVASVLSPVPGGVGPVTVAMLFRNVLEVAKKL